MGSLTCHWCGITAPTSEFDIHSSPSGFWCPECEGFTYMDETERERHRFLLLLEDKGQVDTQSLSPAIPKLKKRLSPLRYPGGKSKLIDYLYSKLSQEQLDTFVEVFAGGASLGLALLDAGIVKQLILNDKDPAELAEMLQNMYKSFPEPDIIVTYDNHPRIREMYPLAKQEIIQRRYSI